MPAGKLLPVCCAAAISFAAALAWMTPPGSAQTGAPAYLNPKLPIERRVDDLLQRMTLKEKVGQLNLPVVSVKEMGKDIPSKMEACRRFAAGTYTEVIGPGCGFFSVGYHLLQSGARQQAEFFNQLQRIAVRGTRLMIPLLEDERHAWRYAARRHDLSGRSGAGQHV